MNFKRIIAAALVFTMFGGELTPYCRQYPLNVITSNAKSDEEFTEVKDGALNYQVFKDHAEVVGCTKDKVKGEFAIPDNIKGVPVTNIHLYSFYYCKNLTSIIIPDTVTIIGDYAFKDCVSLQSITIPDSVTTIGAGAFYNCKHLESTTIPNSVTKIGNKAFYCCEGLASITIPDSVTSIEDATFYCCGSLKSITIMNPNCHIYEKKTTITSYLMNPFYYGVIRSYEGSIAQEYAEKYGYKFEAIDETETATTSTITTTSKTTSTTTSTTTTSDETTTSSSQTTVKEPFEMVSDSRILGVWELYKIVDSETGEESDFDPANVLYRYTFTDDFRCVVHLSQLTGENKMEKDTLCSWTAAESVTGGKNHIYMEIVGEDEKSEAQIIELVDGELVVAPYVGIDSSVRFYMKKVDDSPVKAGDVNEDGIINAVDASRVLVFYAALNAGETEVSEKDMAVCDINKDNMINAIDASLILAYYANLNADPDLTLEAFLEDKLNK